MRKNLATPSGMSVSEMNSDQIIEIMIEVPVSESHTE